MSSIVIKSRETDEVVKRIDVNGMTERQVERTERGMNINLDHERFYTEIEEVEA